MPERFSKLDEIIKHNPGLSGVRKIIEQGDVVREFFNILPDLKKIAEPVKVDQQVLFLRVENAAWRSELRFSESTIIEKINKHFKQIRVSAVKFVN